MFRHRGAARKFKHNLGIASLLSFVAGTVNVAGFLSVQRLTTNVTGHFAMLVDEAFQFQFLQAFHFFLYIFFFLLGAFVSRFWVEWIHRKNIIYEYIVPVILESIILFFVAGYGQTLLLHYPNILAYLLLFAMGVQNSLVTTLSNSVVRTTHLTGLFTDLGIELAQLFFYKQPEHQSKLWASIQLRLAIIISFFIGGVMGGIFYAFIQLHILSLAAGVLLLGVTLDYWKLKLIHLKRKQLIRLKQKQMQ